jgi:hypothetical protein
MSRTAAVLVGLLLVAAAVAAALFVTRDRSWDRAFDATVARPAYEGNGPVVLFDEGHLNTHTIESGYRPLADLLRNDGYTVRASDGPLTAEALAGIGVLVLPVARGANETNDDPAYTDAEGAAVEAWVRGGGSLLLVADHWPYGVAVAPLARRLGVEMWGGMVQDTSHYEPGRGDTHLIFSAENGLVAEHPITRGRDDAERVRRVLTFTGQSVQGPAGAVAFLALSPTAVEFPPGAPRAEHAGGDVVVSMEYGDPLPAAGRGQGIAFELDSGRVVVLGEAGMLRAQRERDDVLVGMNVPGYDNRQLALNIVRWLSGVL